jgi:hypothetical protein
MIRNQSLTLLAALSLAFLALLQATTAHADGPPPTTEGSITVHVVDANNNNVPGATVRVMVVGGSSSINTGDVVVTTSQHGGVVAVVRTGDDGTCEIKGLPIQGYNVIAKLKGVGRGKAHVEITGGSAGATQASITITLIPPKPKPQTQP